MESDTPFRSLILAVSPARATDDEIRKLSQGLIASNDLKALAAFNRGLHTLVADEAALAAVRVSTLDIIGSADRNRADMQELKKLMPPSAS